MKRMRKIDLLRERIGGTWRYEPPCFYVHVESGRQAHACAALSPRFDGDDDTFSSQLRWSDSGELIWSSWL